MCKTGFRARVQPTKFRSHLKHGLKTFNKQFLLLTAYSHSATRRKHDGLLSHPLCQNRQLNSIHSEADRESLHEQETITAQ